ncbi:helix-turn-helix transcriptional regulator [Thermoguttaceae bacterium LCP21S3_D4]
MASEKEGTDKIERVLGIYTKLINGSVVRKSTEATYYGVNERSIQRDIDDIRNYLDIKGIEDGIINTVVYDRMERGYRLEQIYRLKFTNPEILAICKILLDSRAFTKDEMENMLQKLIDGCVPADNQKLVKELIVNEEFHYIEPKHGSVFIGKMWDVGEAIHNNQYIEIKYQGIQGSTVKTRKLKPLAILFSEYYFYLTAFIEDEKVRENFNVINDSFPTIYRIDRIQSIKVLNEKYHIPYSNRFEEGEFRKRIQFMYGGKLRKVRFIYKGYSVEAVLDRLPTAKIEREDNGQYTISAEVFGDGIDMWIRSQGSNIQII